MSDWISVVTHPLGLAGFALFLVFSARAWLGDSGKRLFMTLAAVALLAGVGMAAFRTAQEPVSQVPQGGVPPAATGTSPPVPAKAARSSPASTNMSTTGDNSPVINQIEGDANFNFGASPNADTKGGER
jgi:hypothetical protein